MISKDKRKLAAIMFADVVGYSRMMANNEERTLELLKDFENICSPIISDNEGKIIKKVGDELFCEFSSAKEAVDCSLKIQKAIQPYNDSRPKDFKLQVRIGIHVGDIVLRDGDVFGDGVNVASRIQPFSNPGGICISNAVKESISSHPNYNIISEGQQELKNIIEKHTLYRVETGYEIVDKNRKIDKPKVEKKNKWIRRFFIFIGFIITMNILAWFVTWNVKNNLIIEKITNQIETPITKKELDAEKTRILVPHLGSRSELVKFYNDVNNKSFWVRKYGTGSEKPSDYTVTSFTIEESNELYAELVTKIKTAFFPDNIIYTSEDVERAFEEKAQMSPDFTTFKTNVEEELPQTLLNIINIVDDNEYANQLILIINVYNINPPIGYRDKIAHIDVLFKNVYDIVRNDTGTFDKITRKHTHTTHIGSNQERLIPDIINFINDLIQEHSSNEFIAEIKSINKDKIFIKMQIDKPLLKNTELSALRLYKYQDSESIQNRIDHIKEFMECCNNNPEDKDCFNFQTRDMWNQREYDELINNQHRLQSGRPSRYVKNLNKIILINEVYDSIAVGKVIENPNTCIKLLPGDLLKLNK